MEHLKFTKVIFKERQRRKGKFPPQSFHKDFEKHGKKLDESVKGILESQKVICKKFHFAPHLLLKIELEESALMSKSLKEKLLAFGLEVIAEESKELTVLFAEDINVPDFSAALAKYKNGEIATKHVIHKELFNMIKSVTPWSSHDRTQSLDIYDKKSYYDVYLWVFDSCEENEVKFDEFKKDINRHNIRICDSYVSTSVVVVRVQGDEADIDIIKENPLVYQIQNIPIYTVARNKAIEERETKISDVEFDNSQLNPDESASICVIDSGIFKGHPLFEGVIGDSKVFYGEIGIQDDDKLGHGTMVASICAYGDVSRDKSYRPDIYILNAKVHDGEYISEFNLCISELRENGIEPSFEQQQLIETIYDRNGDIDDLLTNATFANFATHVRNYIAVIVSRYMNIYEKLIPNQMKDIVTYFTENYGCKIFNLSQGDKNQVFMGGKPNAWSCVLDELQHRYDILFVVSTGNYHPELDISPKKIQEKYPLFLIESEKPRINEPANSALSLTVGSLAVSNVPVSYSEYDIDPLPVTKKNELSTMTRVGCGSNGAIKPDLVYLGGDRHIVSRVGDYKLSNTPNRGLSILGFNTDIVGSLFKHDFGSSFAAPYISHLAAKLLNKYPKLSMNAVRAFLAYSASIPLEVDSKFNQVFDKYSPNDVAPRFQRNQQGQLIFDKKRIICFTSGYGAPSKSRIIDSEKNRVVVYSDVTDEKNKLAPDIFHIYEIPMIEEFRRASGKKIIEVVLAYNPEVRKTRMDYLGTSLNFELIRGKTLEEVYQVYATQKGKDENEKLNKFEKKYSCKCVGVGSQIRNKGTLQKMKFEFSRTSDEYGDNYYVVVNSVKKWSSKKLAYSIIIALETEAEIEIYSKIKAKIELSVRRRVRM